MPIEQNGQRVRIRPSGPVVGDVLLPGSKSLTNRYLTCAALADGTSVLSGASFADDAGVMVSALRQLGVTVHEQPAQHLMEVSGCRGHLPADDADLNAGHAGTAMRFLTALVCLGHGRFRLDGSARMRERPIGGLVDALRSLGASIGYEGREGYPPLTVLARGLAGGEVVFSRPPSSQFVSALLMVAPYARQDVMIRIDGPLVSEPYVDLTLQVMRSMGVELLDWEGCRFVVPAFQRYRPGRYEIEPDASAATYFWAAAAVTGGRVRVVGLTRASRQGDVGFVDVLARMGCVVEEDEMSLAVAGPHGRLRGIVVDLNDMPDTVQTLAAVALFAEGPTEIRNVANLRLKETDRLAALAAELTRLGARVDAHEDGLTIYPPQQVQGAEIQTYEDHRMAMSLAVAGLAAEGIVIRDADCVSKSFPAFFEVLGGLTTTSR